MNCGTAEPPGVELHGITVKGQASLGSGSLLTPCSSADVTLAACDSPVAVAAQQENCAAQRKSLKQQILFTPFPTHLSFRDPGSQPAK